MKAIVPSNCPWNSPAPVICVASRAAAPKSAIRMLCPVESTKIFAPTKPSKGIMVGINYSPNFGPRKKFNVIHFLRHAKNLTAQSQLSLSYLMNIRGSTLNVLTRYFGHDTFDTYFETFDMSYVDTFSYISKYPRICGSAT